MFALLHKAKPANMHKLYPEGAKQLRCLGKPGSLTMCLSLVQTFSTIHLCLGALLTQQEGRGANTLRYSLLAKTDNDIPFTACGRAILEMTTFNEKFANDIHHFH